MFATDNLKPPGPAGETNPTTTEEPTGKFKSRTVTLRKTMRKFRNELHALCKCIKNFFLTLLCNRKVEKQQDESYELTLRPHDKNNSPQTPDPEEYENPPTDDNATSPALSASGPSIGFGDLLSDDEKDDEDPENVTNDPLARDNSTAVRDNHPDTAEKMEALPLDSSKIRRGREWVNKTKIWFKAKLSRSNRPQTDHLQINRVKYTKNSPTNDNMEITFDKEGDR